MRPLLLALAALAPFGLWAVVSIPHAFGNGSVADADQVNENFDALKDAVNARHGDGASLPGNGTRGDFFSRDDGRLFFHDGTRWRAVQLESEAPPLPSGVSQADVLNHLVFDGNVIDTGSNASGTSVSGPSPSSRGPSIWPPRTSRWVPA